MNRIVIIDLCDYCPFFNNEYYDYAETCEKLNRRITGSNEIIGHPIPDDCPLPRTIEAAIIK